MSKKEYELLKKYQSVIEFLTYFNYYKNPYEKTLKDFDIQNYSDTIYKSISHEQLLNLIFVLGLEEFSKKLKTITQKSDSYNINELVQNNILSVKINSQLDIIPVNDFVILLNAFKEIFFEFIRIFEIDTSSFEVVLVDARLGCFNFKLGLINVDIELNLIKFENKDKEKEIKKYIKDSTGKSIKQFNNISDLLISCVSNFMTKQNSNKKYTYIDLKASNKQKKIIYKTLEKFPELTSIQFNEKEIHAENIDFIL